MLPESGHRTTGNVPPVSSSRFDAVSLEALRRRRTVKWSLYGPDVLAAWVAEMDFDVAEPVKAALLDAVEREDFGYTPADLTELTTACAGFLADAHGWEVPPARIFPVADVLVGIAGALDVLLPPGGVVVVPTPAYPPFFEVVALGGRAVVEVPLTQVAGRPALDIDAIDAALERGARAVLLCNPHNPTGRAFEFDELARLADVVERHRGRIVADEVHAPLVHPGSRHVPYATVSSEAAEHSVTVTSASKAWNIPGLKCAQVVTTNHADAACWRALPGFKVAGPTPLGIAASIAAYRSGGPWLRDLLTYLDANRRRLATLLATELPGVSYRKPDATYLAWLDCTGLGLDDPATFFLHEARVAVNDGPAFGAGYESFIRLNFATSSALLERIVHAMGKAHRGR
jgi:cysteine-S-conjugate beta-lyase